jgi:hypothetical protein
MNVAFASLTTRGNYLFLPGYRAIRQHHLFFSAPGSHYRTNRHFKLKVLAVPAVLLLPLTVSSLSGAIKLVIPVSPETAYPRLRYHYNVAAVTAVTAVRPPELHIFFVTEAYRSVTTVSGFDSDINFIVQAYISLFVNYFR